MHWYIEAPLGYAWSAMPHSTEPNFLGVTSRFVSTRPGFSACVAETGHLQGICMSRLYVQNAWYRTWDVSFLLLSFTHIYSTGTAWSAGRLKGGPGGAFVLWFIFGVWPSVANLVVRRFPWP